MLKEQIREIANQFINKNPKAAARFLERLVQDGAITRDEDSVSHFCVYFLPYDPAAKKVFIVHHKKSGLWLSPGGHIDKGELLLDSLNREINEELGVVNFFNTLPEPFLISAVKINNPRHPCKEHLDIWFLMETDGVNFKVDPLEFHSTEWMDFEKAEKIITDKSNLDALKILRELR